MKRRVGIIGLGKVGKSCAEAIAATKDLAAAGIVRRRQSLNQPLPQTLRGVSVVTHASELGSVDTALICLPAPLVLEAAKDLLQHRIPIVEAATVPSAGYRSYRREIDQVAVRHNVAAVVGAGWEPGMLSLFRGVFAMLCPKGHTEIRDRPGVSLHHTIAARSVSGVKNALCAEFRAGSGKIQRYVYVELEHGADLPGIQQMIQSDPLFLDEETLVLPVDNIAELEDEGHGVVLERWGTSAGKAHQHFLLEGRFDRVAVTAQIMVAAARALPTLAPGRIHWRTFAYQRFRLSLTDPFDKGQRDACLEADAD
jgi:diaminopimelate dehydrogenase